MFLASQLTEVSGRFAAHVQEIREFLLKERLAVPSPDAIPELASRLGTDLRFRADMASLMRATLYREREGIGYEELLGILVAAAAGTKQDLTSESQEADIREMLRFLLQSRRPAYRADSEEQAVAVQPEPREPVPANAEPVHAITPPPADSMSAEPRLTGRFSAMADADSREAADLVLPFRTAGLFAAEPESSAAQPELFAAQPGLEEPWWRAHSSCIVGAACMLVGLGAGLMIHRTLPAAHTQAAVATLGSGLSKPEAVGSAVPKGSAAGKRNVLVARKHAPIVRQPAARQPAGVEGQKPEPLAGTAEPAPVPDADRATEQPAAAFEGRSTPPPVTPEKTAAVPMTVVKQVVRASLSASPDSGDSTEDAPSTAETHSIVRQGSAGIMAANVVYSPPPEYPAEASAARVQGQVTVRAVVDPEGKVIYARAVSGPPLLRDAALEAVQKWRYRPLLYYGKPIAVTTTAILDFRFAK